ncbi:hypothetical protein DL990_15740 [Amycolatopsis sp. WAC 01416]|uniref:hypothetical protein n=1 Tax=Amycolatopsis sp. WAC 01416 TaxID=2203196 RepID=UPI000F785962|nr:hypothetical protein [Amycolatopsis sp. WAC 01416]RSN33414.1 hypothetical protein DL990_15740 [Amycolatopsis sp. WAC 01416]
MDELENRLRGIELAEPPLGFDPDEVAGTAAKKVRNRRAVAVTGAATLAIIAAAVVFVAPGHDPVVTPAGPPSPTTVQAGPAKTPKPPVSPKVDLTAQKARITGHLAATLPTVLAGTSDIRVRSVHQLRTENDWDVLVVMVGYRDAAGAERPLVITISGTEAAKLGFSLEDSCKPGRKAINGFDADIGGVTSGEPVDCTKTPRADGSTVVVSGLVPSLPAGDVEPARSVTMYRADGTSVAVTAGTSVTVTAGTGGGGSIPADDQLIGLVTDPELNLR